HRDLKPGNIMVRNDGEVLIMDFGIARSSGALIPTSEPIPSLPTQGDGSKRFTAATITAATRGGPVFGTLQYMAPEQARGEDVDQRADIYALGLILYDMLAGHQRLEGAESPVDELFGRMERAPRSLQEIVPDVPKALSRLVGKCLEPDPGLRFQTTADLAAEL